MPPPAEANARRAMLPDRLLIWRDCPVEPAEIKGVPAVTWHALRHTHASQLLAAGVDIVTVLKRLGHAKPDITLRVYSHLMPGADAAAVAAMDKAFAAFRTH
ncbi:MAG TPA: tyrosine-type recombinase/integrase [Prosthecobacter sp.]|nr:tyrosine-type recombinase/integrase [Prosthecobacter sp.]